MENGIANIPMQEEVTFFEALMFSTKVKYNLVKRFYENLFDTVPKHKNGKFLEDAKCEVISKSVLWTTTDTEKNWMLTAGKVENLRIACRYLDGLEIEANSVFSFWKQIGIPSANKGYTAGRELREGCIVPTIAGGLCQLSNALYDCALKMDLEIIERHKHSKVVKGSLAEQDKDATIKWNYIDLRFRSASKFRIEARLSDSELIVSFKSNDDLENPVKNLKTQSVNKLNDCFSCGNTKCFQHPNKILKKSKEAVKVFVLDNLLEEQVNYIETILEEDNLIITSDSHWRNNTICQVKYYDFTFSSKWTYLMGRLKQKVVFESRLEFNAKKARLLLQKIPVNCRYIIISQSLLPFAKRSGLLGGRTYEVIVTSLPMVEIHKQLDFAYKKHPENLSLMNYRADDVLVDNEFKGLSEAAKLISPHAGIQKLFPYKVIKLNWKIPQLLKSALVEKGKVLFPNKLLARFGAVEIVKLSCELNIEILYLDGAMDSFPNLKQASLSVFDGDWNRVEVVVNPTFVQGCNKMVLQAVGRGIPVITSSANGLSQRTLVYELEVGDYIGLKSTLMKTLHITESQLH